MGINASLHEPQCNTAWASMQACLALLFVISFQRFSKRRLSIHPSSLRREENALQRGQTAQAEIERLEALFNQIIKCGKAELRYKGAIRP
jgi:hypothetical protein